MVDNLLSLRTKKILLGISLIFFALMFLPYPQLSLNATLSLSISFISLLISYRVLSSLSVTNEGGNWLDSATYKLCSVFWILLAINRALDIFLYKQKEFSTYQLFIFILYFWLIASCYMASKSSTFENKNAT